MNVKIVEPQEGDVSVRPKTRSQVVEMPDNLPLPPNAIRTDEPVRDWKND